MSKDTTWSKVKLTNLIKAVKDHPCLWQSRNSSFKDTRVRNAAWSEISELFESSTDEVQQQWCNIRNQYRRTRISAIKNGTYFRAYYNYHKILNFLDESEFNLENSMDQDITDLECAKAKLFEIPKCTTLSVELNKDKFKTVKSIPTNNLFSSIKNEKSSLPTKFGKREKPKNVNNMNKKLIEILPRQQQQSLTSQDSRQLIQPAQNQRIIFIPNYCNRNRTNTVTEALEKHNITLNTLTTKVEKTANPQIKEQDSIIITKPTSIQKFMLSMADQLADLDGGKQREAMIGVIQTINRGNLKMILSVFVTSFFCVICNTTPIEKPNIVMFLSDDFGYGDLSVYGHPSQEQTILDKMALEGIRFTSFYSSSFFCTPSRAALLTGRLPHRSGIIGDIGKFSLPVLLPSHSTGLPHEEYTLAEALRDGGYKTGIVGKWHLGINQYNHKDGTLLPHTHGFDYVGHILPFSLEQKCDDMGHHQAKQNRNRCFVYKNDTIVEQPIRFETLSQRFLEDAQSFIYETTMDKTSNKPFFLYYSLPQPHTPMFNMKRFNGKSKRGHYGDQILEMSWQVEEIVNLLKAENQLNNTLVLFLSDHGPHLEICGEGGNSGPLKGGKGTAFEGGVRVPAIAWWPGKLKPAVSTEIFNLMDIFPTLLSLVNISLPNIKLDGYDNHESLINSKKASKRETNFFYCSHILMAVQYRNYKIHYYEFDKITEEDIANNCKNGRSIRDFYMMGLDCENAKKLDTAALYNIDMDPGEAMPLDIDDHQDVINKFDRIVKEHKENLTYNTINRLSKDYTDSKLTPCCSPPYCLC
ncbi:DgyrCDS4850 [Dimorphilus gyrociliatus]|uniref:DgyrCDS4850 n=1 Tax=Dimorphilus gyrociliatus TaxID=2664684 RepID=A0A7I8VJN1_9ANNE|nr:DgyrCDS4850 [Dimorphilus gyrociliatus]